MGKGKILLSFSLVSILLLGIILHIILFYPSPKAEAASHADQKSPLIRENSTTVFQNQEKAPLVKGATNPTSTLTPTPTPTPTLTPIKSMPTPTLTSKPATNSDPQPANSISDYLLARVNDYRESQGLNTVSSNSETCSFAATRVQEISTGFSHDGFTNRINSHTLPYPSYHEITENIAMNPDYADVVTQWINSPGHAENMRADTPFVCVEKFGNYYAYEGWKP